MAFEALILGFTIFKTIGLKREAEALGIRTSLHSLLLRDGRRFVLIRALCRLTLPKVPFSLGSFRVFLATYAEIIEPRFYRIILLVSVLDMVLTETVVSWLAMPLYS